MGDDLIIRKELLEKVLKEEYDNDIHKDGRAKAMHHGEYQHFYKTISEMPTAYNADKVVEQLEEYAKYFHSEADELAQKGDFGTATDLQGRATAYRDAAKIVKSGGVADD